LLSPGSVMKGERWWIWTSPPGKSEGGEGWGVEKNGHENGKRSTVHEDEDLGERVLRIQPGGMGLGKGGGKKAGQ